MKIRIRDFAILPGLIFVLLLSGCVTTNYVSGVKQNEVLNKKMFLATNLHADRGSGSLYSINYQVTGELLSWGTPVIINEDESIDSGGGRRYYLTDLNNNKKHDFFFHHRTNKYISDNNYFSEILIENIDSLKDKIAKLSDIDQQGIKRGVVSIGMSKDGVKISIGIPPIFANKTPEKSKKWNYWYDKRRKFAVDFDENDKVVSITGKYLHQ
ncbi:MAG: hypothetical protein MUO43_11180 [Desulfobacterales bacterium]|nr:hypothetical protein [Desulfobacterales bacterium]